MPTPRRALLLALLTLLPAGAALASPATDLYSAATRAVNDSYYGWATQNFSLLAGEYAQRLSERCAPLGEACDYATGRAVLGDLFGAFGDDHTNVRDTEGAERLREISQNLAVQRTGLRVVRADGGLLTVSVAPGSPAERAGLRRFDLLTTVQGQAAGKRGTENAPVGPAEFVRLERAGVPFEVTVARAGAPERTLTLSTARLQARDVPTLSWAGEGGKVAVIDFPTFLPDDSARLFLARVREAQAAGARALVVDLRYNGGGSLSQCVAAASIYGPVVYKTQFRVGGFTYTGLNGEEGHYLDTLFAGPGDRVWTGPSAVLVGPNTASCAEVFSVYAQRAGVRVVGETTRGVGNSGVVFQNLPDGGVLAVTVLRAYGRDDQPLPQRVTPDLAAPTDVAALTLRGEDTALNAALGALVPATSISAVPGPADRVSAAPVPVGPGPAQTAPAQK